MCGEAYLSTLATDAAGKLDVLGHDGDTLGVDGAQVGVLKQSDQVSLAGLLQCHHGAALEAQVRLEVLSNLADQTLERQLADQQLGALLVAANLTQGHRAGPVAVRLLDSAGGRRALTSGLGGQLLAWRLATGRLACGLLRTGHGCEMIHAAYLKPLLLSPHAALLQRKTKKRTLRMRKALEQQQAPGRVRCLN